jgi:hypothetical protein
MKPFICSSHFVVLVLSIAIAAGMRIACMVYANVSLSRSLNNCYSHLPQDKIYQTLIKYIENNIVIYNT